MPQADYRLYKFSLNQFFAVCFFKPCDKQNSEQESWICIFKFSVMTNTEMIQRNKNKNKTNKQNQKPKKMKILVNSGAEGFCHFQ